MSSLVHVAPAGALSPGHTWKLAVPGTATAPQKRVLRDVLGPSGAVSPWGLSMLASQANPLVAGDGGLIRFGLASAPGAPADPTLHVTEAGRDALRATCNRLVEVVFELVRERIDPNAPSRFQALFAYETVSQAEAFIADRRQGPHDIWEIDVPAGTPTHAGDGAWLGIPASPLDFIGAAAAYWSGAQTNTSVPHDHEVLVPLEAPTAKALVKTIG